MEFGNDGIMEIWNLEVIGIRNNCIREFWNYGFMKLWNDGMMK